jgi:hypothetical protein
MEIYMFASCIEKKKEKRGKVVGWDTLPLVPLEAIWVRKNTFQATSPLFVLPRRNEKSCHRSAMSIFARLSNVWPRMGRSRSLPEQRVVLSQCRRLPWSKKVCIRRNNGHKSHNCHNCHKCPELRKEPIEYVFEGTMVTTVTTVTSVPN